MSLTARRLSLIGRAVSGFHDDEGDNPAHHHHSGDRDDESGLFLPRRLTTRESTLLAVQVVTGLLLTVRSSLTVGVRLRELLCATGADAVAA